MFSIIVLDSYRHLFRLLLKKSYDTKHTIIKVEKASNFK